MRVEVIHEITPGRLERLKELFDDARAADDHQALGEHKWLDLVHGGRAGFAGVVATDNGDEPVGYAHISRHRVTAPHWGLEIVVHPTRRGRDVEDTLVGSALGVVREAGGGHVHLWVFQPTGIHDEVARRHGLARGRDLLHMRVPLPVDTAPTFPPGVHVRAFDPAHDEQPWLELNNAAFDQHPEQGAWDIDTFRLRMQEDWFDPRDLLLAEEDTKIVGSNWTKLDHARRVGEIYVIAVDPSRHGSGLGKALSLAGLHHMTERGMKEGALYVDAANQKALRMYEAIGFRTHHRDRAYVADVA